MAGSRLRELLVAGGAVLLLGPAMAPASAPAREDAFALLRPLLGRWQGVGEGLGGADFFECRSLRMRRVD